MTRGAIGALLLVVTAAACGAEKQTSNPSGCAHYDSAGNCVPAGTLAPTGATTTTNPEVTTRAKEPKPARFTGVDAENYRINYFSCDAYSIKNLSRQLHVPAEPVAIAEELASDYRAAYRQAAFEGCLDALLNKKPQVKGQP